MPISSIVISRPVLPELPLGEDRRLRGGVLRLRAGGRTQGRGRGQRTGLEERAAVGAVGLVVGHCFSTPRWMDVRYESALPDERILARPDGLRTVNRRVKMVREGEMDLRRVERVTDQPSIQLPINRAYMTAHRIILRRVERVTDQPSIQLPINRAYMTAHRTGLGRERSRLHHPRGLDGARCPAPRGPAWSHHPGGLTPTTSAPASDWSGGIGHPRASATARSSSPSSRVTRPSAPMHPAQALRICRLSGGAAASSSFKARSSAWRSRSRGGIEESIPGHPRAWIPRANAWAASDGCALPIWARAARTCRTGPTRSSADLTTLRGGGVNPK